MLLAKFEVTVKESPLRGYLFEAHGTFSIEKDNDGNRYPVFEDVTLMHLENDVRKEYTPEGRNWYGHRYSGDDIISSVFSHCCIINDCHRIEYWHPELDALIKEYTSDIVLTVEDLDIPKRIISPSGTIYRISHVTNEFIYYSSSEQILMLSAQTHHVLSDNCFAENAWYESMENVMNGTEQLLYGELPKDL